ncbi:MAG: methyltransferase domain-containing protein [Bdellovibrionales bacterium]|nr:methyltransferase domain-containing protein [Bdellovibrionales bacterium]
MNDLSPQAWNERYQSSDTPWDLGGPTPELIHLLKDGTVFPPRSSVLVPGAGRGHDAVELAKAGHQVHVVEFAPVAFRQLLELSFQEKVDLQAFRLNFFDLLPGGGYHKQFYDAIFEYTFFCAIDPKLRVQYMEHVHGLLRPGGVLVGIFFPTASDKAGPPFLVNEKEIHDLFSPRFEVSIGKTSKSVNPREGREFLAIIRKK